MQFTREGNGRREIYLGPFAYNYYVSGMSATEYLLHAVEMRDHLRIDLKLQVDHVDNNSHNHCKWNLKAVSGEQNGAGAKGSLVAQVKWPYYVSPCVHESGEYLVEYGYCSFYDGQIKHSYVRCPTEDALVSFLRTVFGWLPPAEEEYDDIGSAWDVLIQSKKEGVSTSEDFACDSFDFAVRSYDRKMSIPLDEYPVWII